MSFIETERLIICPFERHHLTETYVSWLNDKSVCEFNGHRHFPYTMAKAESYLEYISKASALIVVALHQKSDKAHIGNASIGDIDFLNSSATLNILIGEKESWGRGYAFEALSALLRHAFLELNLNRVSCGTSDCNIAMQRVALKLGMKQEGVRRSAMYKNGSYIDMLEYSILKSEYK